MLKVLIRPAPVPCARTTGTVVWFCARVKGLKAVKGWASTTVSTSSSRWVIRICSAPIRKRGSTAFFRSSVKDRMTKATELILKVGVFAVLPACGFWKAVSVGTTRAVSAGAEKRPVKLNSR